MRIDSNEKTPSGCLGRGVKGFIASMKRTPWRGVLKNECKGKNTTAFNERNSLIENAWLIGARFRKIFSCGCPLALRSAGEHRIGSQKSEVSETVRRSAGDRADVCQPDLLSQKPLIRVVRTNPDPQKSIRHINCDCAITCSSYSNRVNVAHFLEP
jgi:hypothetical protein